MDIFPPTQQRAALLPFAERIDSRSTALRRDECSDWRISGRRGHIYADGLQGFVMVATPGSSRSWHTVRDKLAAFSTLTQDGDDEGALRMDRLPTIAEGAIIREALTVAKRRHLSDEERERLRRTGFQGRLAA